MSEIPKNTSPIFSAEAVVGDPRLLGPDEEIAFERISRPADDTGFETVELAISDEVSYPYTVRPTGISIEVGDKTDYATLDVVEYRDSDFDYSTSTTTEKKNLLALLQRDENGKVTGFHALMPDYETVVGREADYSRSIDGVLPDTVSPRHVGLTADQSGRLKIKNYNPSCETRLVPTKDSRADQPIPSDPRIREAQLAIDPATGETVQVDPNDTTSGIIAVGALNIALQSRRHHRAVGNADALRIDEEKAAAMRHHKAMIEQDRRRKPMERQLPY